MPPTAAQIKKIHAIKGALKLDDETYRAMLSGYGVKSSTKLSIARADELIADIEQKAVAVGVWEKRNSTRAGSRIGDDPQTMKIRALWGSLYKAGKIERNTDLALCAFVKRITKKDALRWCTPAEKGRVIEALKQWLER